MGTAQRSVVIVIAYASPSQVIVVQKVGDASWDFPGTRIAEGEWIIDAARRIVSLSLGISARKERFGGSIRDVIGRDGVRRISVRIDLTPREVRNLSGRSPCGTRHVCVVDIAGLLQYIPERYRRAMMHAG